MKPRNSHEMWHGNQFSNEYNVYIFYFDVDTCVFWRKRRNYSEIAAYPIIRPKIN